MMKLQNVILGDDVYPDRRTLFYTLDKRQASCILGFGTYFNTFWQHAWTDYTGLNRFSLNVRFKGGCTLSLIQSCLSDAKADPVQTGQFILARTPLKILHRQRYQSDGTDYIRIPLPEPDPAARMIHFEIEYAAGEAFEFIEGHYSADTAAPAPSKIAIVICTFKRETFVYRNLDLLKEYFRRYPELNAVYDVFVIDNGQTVSSAIKSDSVFLYPNKNTGGSGGFTRGIIEALQSDRAYTHVLLMDDDIEINTEALQRTYALTALLTPACKRSFIAGSMLLGDLRDFQWEARSKLKGLFIESYAQFSLSRFPSLLINEFLAAERDPYDYAAWWYCCIPLEAIGPDKLPFPLFVRGDDIDYSLKFADKIIHLNGICVWHEPFEGRRSNVMDMYLTIRNFIVINLVHSLSLWRTVLDLMTLFAGNLFTYNYKGADLLCSGLRDAIERPDIFLDNQTELLKRYAADNEVEEIIPVNLSKAFYQKKLSRGLKLLIVLTYGGHLLPDFLMKQTNEAIHGYRIAVTKCFACQRVLVYNPRTGKTIRRQINRLYAVKLGFRLAALLLKYILLYPLIKKRTLAKERFYRTTEFWKKHLEL
jgi:galactofuranosylgalactofuranosylrhamnosyl-N-acetylglucosaminyl-diphospho-decaprenol beta-1,5/1,6-galactofuranosyltransferase